MLRLYFFVALFIVSLAMISAIGDLVAFYWLLNVK